MFLLSPLSSLLLFMPLRIRSQFAVNHASDRVFDAARGGTQKAESGKRKTESGKRKTESGRQAWRKWDFILIVFCFHNAFIFRFYFYKALFWYPGNSVCPEAWKSDSNVTRFTISFTVAAFAAAVISAAPLHCIADMISELLNRCMLTLQLHYCMPT